MESEKPTSYVDALKILSAAEVKVIDLVERGYTSSEIAKELGNSPRTIQTHRNNICRKLGIKVRLGLIKWLWMVMNGENK